MAEQDELQLVVDTGQADAVIAALRKRQVLPNGDGIAAADDVLGLTLLMPLDERKLASHAQGVRVEYFNEIHALTAAGREFTDLDVLLYGLRREFARLGLVPIMGKNRDSVLGFPRHKGMAAPPVLLPRPNTIAASGAGANIKVGVVDTPLAGHNLLPEGLVDGDRISDGEPTTTFSGHATFVAGLIRQAAPGAAIEVGGGLNGQTGESKIWDAAVKIAQVGASGIDLLNLSFGCVTADHEPPLVLRRALDRLPGDVLVIAAAGNRNLPNEDWPIPPAEIWPAASTDVVAVGALRDYQNGVDRAEFSMQRKWVDCLADGVDVASIYPLGRDAASAHDDDRDGWAEWSGTSFSAATVTGKVAAVMSQHKGLSARAALELLLADQTSGVQRYLPVG